MKRTKIVLEDRDIPAKWYNIMADMPNLPKPPLHPGTRKPVGPDDLSAIFPMALEALLCKEEGKEKAIVFNLSGHGYLDLAAYADFLNGKIIDSAYPEDKINEALRCLPTID